VVIDGTVFIGSQGGTFYAIDEATGEVDWQFETDGNIWSSPSVVDGTVFVPSRGDSVYALAADTGELLGQAAGGYRVAVAGTTIFCLLDDHSIQATDIETGERLWQFGTGAEEFVERAPAVADGKLLVPMNGGETTNNLYALDTETGEPLWEFTPGSEPGFASSPTVADGRVFIGHFDSTIYALDLDTGEKVWAASLPGWPRATPTERNGVVYVANQGQGTNVHALSAASGRQGWSVSTEDSVSWSSPTVADGTVFVGSERDMAGETGYLYALNTTEGQEQWRFEATDSVRSSPVVADGTVIFGDSGNHVYAVDTDTAGSSVGSRVQVATQGHLGDSRHTGASIRGVELQYTEFEIGIEQHDEFVEVGEGVDVDILVKNTGSIAGTQTVEVAIEGSDTESIEVALDAGEETNQMVSLSTETRTRGEQNLTVTSDDDTVTRSVFIEEMSQPDSSPLFAGQTLGGRLLRIGGVLALVSGSGYALFRVAGESDDQSAAVERGEQSTEDIIERADEAVSAGEDALTKREYHTALKQYGAALGLYHDAKDSATDDSVSEELDSRIEDVQDKRETLQKLEEARATLFEELTTAERAFREAVVGHIQGEQTVPRLRYRQARDGFQAAQRRLDETTQDVFEHPLVVDVETDTALPEQLEEVPGIGQETIDRLATAEIETVSDVHSADDGTLDTVEGISDDTVDRLRAVSWLSANDTGKFTGRESIESRLTRAQTGYEMLI